MPQLLLELFCEEIPARMQAKAQADLERAVMDKLSEAGLMAEGVKAFSGPRRLCVVAEGLPIKSADVREERKGPKVGAPEKAIAGFLRGAGLDSIEQAEIQEDKKKGQFYVAVINKPGVETTQIIANMVPEIVRSFHWPKSMRWGSGDMRWVRPLQRILCTFDGEVVPFEIDGIASSNVTQGHRIMGAGPFTVRRFDDYSDILKNKGRVIYDRDERKDIIATEAKTLCDAQGLELVPDIGLLEEVAGLAEFPVVIMGDMDPKFLALPPEVITLSMRVHQKYFAVRDPKTGKLAPKFIVVANLEAEDGGKTIAAGNSKVLSARLSDAVFFYENDKAKKLEERFDSLGNIVFHEKLGTVKDKAERVAALAGELAPIVGAKKEDAIAAAKLAKCDLVAEMVFEFTELEGVMGRYYAMEEGQPQHIADTIRDHYKPKGPSDDVPTEPTAVAVALADKLDTLCSGFWTINELPTGSKDPYALRRSALGVIRLVLENNIRLKLEPCFSELAEIGFALSPVSKAHWTEMWKLSQDVEADGTTFIEGTGFKDEAQTLAQNLLSFFEDRLKVYLRDKGIRHDLLDAVFSLGGDDLVLIVKRVEALGSFLETEDGKNLVSGHKRATNILQKEEKKDGSAITGEIDKKLLSDAAELALHEALNVATANAEAALKKEDFEGAMSALSLLRGPVDTFFDDVIVNAEDNKVRENRLKLLARIRDVTSQVADFSKIEG